MPPTSSSEEVLQMPPEALERFRRVQNQCISLHDMRMLYIFLPFEEWETVSLKVSGVDVKLRWLWEDKGNPLCWNIWTLGISTVSTDLSTSAFLSTGQSKMVAKSSQASSRESLWSVSDSQDRRATGSMVAVSMGGRREGCWVMHCGHPKDFLTNVSDSTASKIYRLLRANELLFIEELRAFAFFLETCAIPVFGRKSTNGASPTVWVVRPASFKQHSRGGYKHQTNSTEVQLEEQEQRLREVCLGSPVLKRNVLRVLHAAEAFAYFAPGGASCANISKEAGSEGWQQTIESLFPKLRILVKVQQMEEFREELTRMKAVLFDKPKHQKRVLFPEAEVACQRARRRAAQDAAAVS